MRRMRRLVGLLVSLTALAAVVVVPLGGAPADAAVVIHWGQSPYYPDCLEGPCRVVLIADKTGDAAVGAQTRRWVDWMNYVRVHSFLPAPAFAYVNVGAEPSCAQAPGFIVLCRSRAVFDSDCVSNPDTVRCTTLSYSLATGHITQARSTLRPDAGLDGPDTWTVVCGALGRAIGLQPSADANSCLSATLTLGSGREKYYVTDDWRSFVSIYNHPPSA